MTKTLITAILLSLCSQLAWAEDFAPMSGYTLQNVGNNRLCNFLNKQANPDALRQGYTTSITVDRLMLEVESRGLKCGKKRGQAWAFYLAAKDTVTPSNDMFFDCVILKEVKLIDGELFENASAENRHFSIVKSGNLLAFKSNELPIDHAFNNKNYSIDVDRPFGFDINETSNGIGTVIISSVSARLDWSNFNSNGGLLSQSHCVMD
jgi:hypothetical protein